MRRPGRKSLPETVPSAIDEQDRALFRAAVKDATPIRVRRRVSRVDKPPPVPVHSLLDIHATIADSISGPIPWEESMETGEELVYLRDNVPRDTLRKLRRGHWVIQDALDLHGLNRDQARALLVEFLAECLRHGHRCIRIIHGKGLGSPNREPVLRGKIRDWLARRSEILAYCQAPENLGGGGATLVLLENPAKQAR
ncbi:MAG: DNA mismatch repair protein MutS [Betaproteobacteria bacterium]|nr:DNA mismatch repair protein MutS [Betaproteobacteria bacterium]